jgi:type II secretory pathway pseudopilin PulG
MRGRNGLSLVELLVFLAILAMLLALLLPTIQRVRESAVRIRSINNLRQIQLAVQNFVTIHDGRVPALNGDPHGPNPNVSVHGAILPYLEQGALYHKVYHEPNEEGYLNYFVRTFVNPADPSLLDMAAETWKENGHSSYAANAQAFRVNYTVPMSFSDGVSNTIAFAEHYGYCGRWIAVTETHFLWWKHAGGSSLRRASFADNGPIFHSSPPGYDMTNADVYPVTKGYPPIAEPSYLPVGPAREDIPPDVILLPITTPFQVAPAVRDCHAAIPQTPHRSGMSVGLMDGSVRTVSLGISMATFWGAVTPSGGEVLGSDW